MLIKGDQTYDASLKENPQISGTLKLKLPKFLPVKWLVVSIHVPNQRGMN
jgi:hypothetical protein